MNKSILFGAVGFLLAGTAAAQGDDCSTATAIGTTGTFAFDSTANTTSGFDGGALCGFGSDTINQDVFYQWTAPAAGDYQIDTETSTFDTKLSVHSGVGCAATCVDYDDDGGAGLQSLIVITGVNMGDTFLIQAGGFGTNAGMGVVNISPWIDPCAAPDALEDNDTIGTASLIASSGTIAGLTVSDTDPDFYEVMVMPGEIVTVDHTVSAGFLDFRVYDAAGNYYRNETFDFRWHNTTAAATSFIFEPWNTSTTAPCADYDLILSVTTDAGCAMDDTFEDNDTCATASPITAGSYPGLMVGLGDRDFYSAVIPAGQTLDVDLSGFAVDVDFEIRDVTCAGGPVDTEFDDFEIANPGPGSITVVFEALIDPSLTQATCTAYQLDVAFTVDPCFMPMDDTFEDNDTCLTAASLGAGLNAGLFVSDSDPDFFSIAIPANQILTFDHTVTSSGFLDFDIYDASCTLLDTEFGDFDYPGGPAGTTIIVEIIRTSTGSTCDTYDLDISFNPDPCAGFPDDAFEDNDDCATATPVSDGTYAGLAITENDKDHYSFCVADGATVACDILFTDAIADLDFFLRDAAAVECGTGNGTNELADGFSVSDNESLTWTNTTGADLNVVLEVNMFAPGTQGCTNYDLVIAGANTCGGTGTTFCDPNTPNSSGLSTTLSGTLGTGVESGLRLDASNGVPSEFGYFLVSAGFADPGTVISNGEFCLLDGTNPFGRYNFGTTTNSIGAFDAAGDFQNLVGTGTSNGGYGYDVATNLPPSVGTTIMSGETWNFQLWHRDTPAGAGTSTFSNGLSITFP